jgi:hypothetical protein
MVARMRSKLDVLHCLSNSRWDVRLAPAVQAAIVNLDRGEESYRTTVGLPVMSDQVAEIYRRRLRTQLESGLIDLGLPETVEVLGEDENEVVLIHCTSELSNIVLFRENLSGNIVGCVVFPEFIRH